MAELNAPVNKLSYSVMPWKAVNPGFAHGLVEDAMDDLLPLLSTRVPLVFGLNGIEAGQYDKSRYHLVLNPRTAIYDTNGGGFWYVEIFIAASIIDREQNSRKVWAGEVKILNSTKTAICDKSVDEFPKLLLAQLSDDKVVKLESGEIKVPSEGKQ